MQGKNKEKISVQKVEFKGRRFEIFLRSDADESVVAEIFKWREYKAAEEIIEKTRLPILDVGAHIGVFSLYAKAINPAVKIYALEPEKTNFELLLKNISANGMDVKSCKVALGSRTEERELIISPDSINHHLGAVGNESTSASKIERVAASSFSDFLKNNGIISVGLLKMDIESGEYEVFENLSEEDFFRIHHIILEYHDYEGRNHKEVEKILREHGFGVQIFPSRFENDLGFMLARNKRAILYYPDIG